jgi:hypothetical protein
MNDLPILWLFGCALIVGMFYGGFHQIFEGAVNRQLLVILGGAIAFLRLLCFCHITNIRKMATNLSLF